MTWRLLLSYLTGSVKVSKLPSLIWVVGGVVDTIYDSLVVGVDPDLSTRSRFFRCVLESFCNPFQFAIVDNLSISDIDALKVRISALLFVGAHGDGYPNAFDFWERKKRRSRRPVDCCPV